MIDAERLIRKMRDAEDGGFLSPEGAALEAAEFLVAELDRIHKAGDCRCPLTPHRDARKCYLVRKEARQLRDELAAL